jgi:hypothetical protein
MVEMPALSLRRIALLPLMAGFAFGADPASVSDLRRGFERPPDDARMMVRWWWFGPSVTKPELEREMRFMKEAALAGSKSNQRTRWSWTTPPRASKIFRS